MASIELLEIVNDATLKYSIVLPLAEQIVDELSCDNEIKQELIKDIPEELMEAVEQAIVSANLELSVSDVDFDPEEWYKEFKAENYEEE